MEKLNDLSFERLRLVNEYVLLVKQLQSYLDTANLHFSKAKTLHGVTLSCLADPESTELQTSIRVSFGDSYQLIEEEINTSSKSVKEDVKDKQRGLKHAFRPFGVLEPMSAKEGRRVMTNALKVVCEMASVQREITKIDKEMKTTVSEIALTSSVLDNLII